MKTLGIDTLDQFLNPSNLMNSIYLCLLVRDIYQGPLGAVIQTTITTIIKPSVKDLFFLEHLAP